MKTFYSKIGPSLLTLTAAIAVLAANAKSQVVVNNVEELYAAVNDPANAGVTVELAPGIYALSVNDPNGTARPNGGRLEVQENMSFIGMVGDRSAVVIDGAGLPATSIPNVIPVLGAIRIGRGRNSIEWLSVRGTRFGNGNIVTGLPYDGTPRLRVAHVASSGAPYQVSIGNFGAGQSGKTLEIDVVDNDLFLGEGGLRQGFRIANLSGATGSAINVRLVGNRIWGNQFSFVGNNGGNHTLINIFSAGNVYFDNGAGLTIVGGGNLGNGNTINYEGHGDRFISNDEVSAFIDRGGLIALGGSRSFILPLGASDNTVNISLFGCRFSNNAIADLGAIGARATPETLFPVGTNNRVIVTLHGMGSAPFTEFVADSIPFDPLTTHSATVIR